MKPKKKLISKSIFHFGINRNLHFQSLGQGGYQHFEIL
jgi:hypothetical protein